MLEQADVGGRRGRNMDWVVQFEGQMLVCALLAKAIYAAPDRPWLDALVRDGVLGMVPFGTDRSEIEAATGHLGMWSQAARREPEASFAAAEDDYTRLFLGPGRLGAAPWESVYLNKDRAVFQMETVSVKNWYGRFELVLASDYNEPADHAGLEFAFLAHLAERTIEASERRDGEQVKRLIDAQRGFLTQHMLRWIPRWAEDVVVSARTDLFRGLGWLARGTVLEAGSFFSAQAAEPARSGPFRREASASGSRA